MCKFPSASCRQHCRLAANASASSLGSDHPGVSNAVLVAEEDPLATKFRKKSVAEQNSVALAWNALMDPELKDLRACIYTNEEEFLRFRQVTSLHATPIDTFLTLHLRSSFRQILVNVVLATDILDSELAALRRNRWDQAFAGKGDDVHPKVENEKDINRKATIVLEHLIQASDVSHTMQHWHVFRVRL